MRVGEPASAAIRRVIDAFLKNAVKEVSPATEGVHTVLTYDDQKRMRSVAKFQIVASVSGVDNVKAFPLYPQPHGDVSLCVLGQFQSSAK